MDPVDSFPRESNLPRLRKVRVFSPGYCSLRLSISLLLFGKENTRIHRVVADVRMTGVRAGLKNNATQLRRWKVPSRCPSIRGYAAAFGSAIDLARLIQDKNVPRNDTLKKIYRPWTILIFEAQSIKEIVSF